jgi:hypothetical protein
MITLSTPKRASTGEYCCKVTSNERRVASRRILGATAKQALELAIRYVSVSCSTPPTDLAAASTRSAHVQRLGVLASLTRRKKGFRLAMVDVEATGAKGWVCRQLFTYVEIPKPRTRQLPKKISAAIGTMLVARLQALTQSGRRSKERANPDILR